MFLESQEIESLLIEVSVDWNSRNVKMNEVEFRKKLLSVIKRLKYPSVDTVCRFMLFLYNIPNRYSKKMIRKLIKENALVKKSDTNLYGKKYYYVYLNEGSNG